MIFPDMESNTGYDTDWTSTAAYPSGQMSDTSIGFDNIAWHWSDEIKIADREHYINYELEPWKVPNHYPSAPHKLIYKSKAPLFQHKNFKQPVSKSGFKKGQRTLNILM